MVDDDQERSVSNVLVADDADKDRYHTMHIKYNIINVINLFRIYYIVMFRLRNNDILLRHDIEKVNDWEHFRRDQLQLSSDENLIQTWFRRTKNWNIFSTMRLVENEILISKLGRFEEDLERMNTPFKPRTGEWRYDNFKVPLIWKTFLLK